MDSEISCIHKLHPIRFNKSAKQEQPSHRKIKVQVDTNNSNEILNSLLKTSSKVKRRRRTEICTAAPKHSKKQFITESFSKGKIFSIPSFAYKKSKYNLSKTLALKRNKSSNDRVFSKDLIDSFKSIIKGHPKKVITNRKHTNIFGIPNKEIQVLYCSQNQMQRHRSPYCKSNINRRKRFEQHNVFDPRSSQSVDINYNDQLSNESYHSKNFPNNGYIMENIPRTSSIRKKHSINDCLSGQHYNLVKFPSNSACSVRKKPSLEKPCVNILLNKNNIIMKSPSATQIKGCRNKANLLESDDSIEHIPSNTDCKAATVVTKDKCLLPSMLSIENIVLQKQEYITNALKCLLFTLTVIIWSPCIFVLYVFRAITYPLRPMHSHSENCEKSNKSIFYFPGPISFKWTSGFFNQIAQNGFCPKLKECDKNESPHREWKQNLKNPSGCSQPKKRAKHPKFKQCYTLQYDHKGGWVLKPTQSHVHAKKPLYADVERCHSSKVLRNGNNVHESQYRQCSPNECIKHNTSRKFIQYTDCGSTDMLNRQTECNIGDCNKIPYKNWNANFDREFRSLDLKNKHNYDEIQCKAHRTFSEGNNPRRFEYLNCRLDHLPRRPLHTACRSRHCWGTAWPSKSDHYAYKLRRAPSACYPKIRPFHNKHYALYRNPSHCHFRSMHNISAIRKRASICKCGSRTKHKLNNCQCKLKRIKKFVINTKNRVICAYRKSEKCTCDGGICDDLYVSVLRDRPCFFIYNCCPSFYPYFIVFLKQCRSSCYLTSYVCSVCVWAPIFVFYYMWFLLFCKCCCEDCL